jgi:hypothetical protein
MDKVSDLEFLEGMEFFVAAVKCAKTFIVNGKRPAGKA